MTAALALGAVGLLAALLLVVAKAVLAAREKENAGAVVEAIGALLPQSQCAQCGYPGCKPYAQAVAAGERLDLCTPGGPETAARLQALLAREAPADELPAPKEQIARIVAGDCVGCALCIDACPVDAIAGAPKYLHAVVDQHCTGCELCVPACPVDCIELIALPADEQAVSRRLKPMRRRRPSSSVAEARPDAVACIRCGWCEPACPVDLSPVALHDAYERELADETAFDCIECGACTTACPSGIDLVSEFRVLKTRQWSELARRDKAEAARQRFDAHTARLEREAQREAAQRDERLRQRRVW